MLPDQYPFLSLSLSLPSHIRCTTHRVTDGTDTPNARASVFAFVQVSNLLRQTPRVDNTTHSRSRIVAIACGSPSGDGIFHAIAAALCNLVTHTHTDDFSTRMSIAHHTRTRITSQTHKHRTSTSTCCERDASKINRVRILFYQFCPVWCERTLDAVTVFAKC